MTPSGWATEGIQFQNQQWANFTNRNFSALLYSVNIRTFDFDHTPGFQSAVQPRH
jgi:hypothetical protein